MAQNIVIAGGIRTPFIKSWTLFDSVGAEQLGAWCLRELVERTGINPSVVDEVIVGCVGQPANAANIARVISLLGGIPKDKKAYTVHRNCASGFEAVTSAYEKIIAGQDQVVIAGGAESMSNIPLFFSKDAQNLFMKLGRAKTILEKLQVVAQFRPKHFSPVAGLMLGLSDPVCGLNMGQTAEVLAKKFGISRQSQDQFALSSNQKTIAAREKLREEIMSIMLPPKFDQPVQDDNGPRDNQNLDALAKLKPAFEKITGSVTAGNSSQITDGACMLIVTTEEKAKELGLEVMGRIVGYDYAGLEPSEMGMGPVFAIDRLMKRTGVDLKSVDLFEINEAFAVQVLACLEAVKSKSFAQNFLNRTEALGEIPMEKLNVNGGGIALGHPVGVSGARLILTALKELKRRNAKRAIVSLCIGGGQGGAVLLERV